MPSVSTDCPINFGYQKSKTVFKWPTKEEEFILATSFGLGEANCEQRGPDQEIVFFVVRSLHNKPTPQTVTGLKIESKWKKIT